jgi:hypothetical protein
VRKIFSALLFFVSLLSGPAQAQQPPRSPILNEGTPAVINCRNQPYVSLLAEPEQIFPLKLVATVKCGEHVVVVSDPEAYYLKIRTADGKVGFVSYLDIKWQPAAAAKPAAPLPAVAAPANPGASGADAQPAAPPGDAPSVDSSRPRVYVSDTKSWAATGGFNPASVSSSDRLYAGYDPELADIYQAFTADCPGVVVTQEVSQADFAVLFDHANPDKGNSGFSGMIKPSKMTVLSRNGQTLFSKSTYNSSGAAVKKACTAIAQHTSPRGAGSSKK